MSERERWVTDQELKAQINENSSRVIPAGEEIEVSSWQMDGNDVRIYWQRYEEGQVGMIVSPDDLQGKAHRVSTEGMKWGGPLG